jgi:pyridoxamine 5'-phosphate oxidase
MATARTETARTETGTGTTDLRELLRRLPVLTGTAPAFVAAQAPVDPLDLFTEWLCHAIDSGVAEPHAMTLSTVDETGRPWARVLICKDVTPDGGWHLAVSSVSRKGRQLTANPVAALTFYWPQLGRQIRVAGAIPDEWTSYAVIAETVEFWQSDPQRRHVRVEYRRAGDGWAQTLLWP